MIQVYFSSEEHRRAYARVLELQAGLLSTQAKDEELVNVRVLGFLLLEFIERRGILGDGPADCLSEKIVEVECLEDVSKLGGLYREKLVRTFLKTDKRKHTPPSSHSSRQDEFDTIEQSIVEMMKGSDKDYRTARKRALARDGFRCAVSGSYDRISCVSNSELLSRARLGQGRADLKCCCILKEGMMRGVDTIVDEVSHDAAGRATSVLELLGLGDLEDQDGLSRMDGVYDLSNILILRDDLHGLFDRLGLWFEATTEDNTYRVCIPEPSDIPPYAYNDLVHFEDHSGRGLSLPSRWLLTLHAVCARVAHMSGAVGFLEELDCEVEDTFVLAGDGSSARLLDHALNPYSIVPSEPVA
ncbi:hypothetical protein PENSPDRAFT_616491 [Peniophora sp. CONT]|nr:hypothetical protein PENSPDRAFT_616491 [Peniophora sp. CONT]